MLQPIPHLLPSSPFLEPKVSLQIDTTIMPPPAAPDHHQYQRGSSFIGMAFRGGRSVLSLRRNQVVSMDQVHEDELHDIDLFQSHVADAFHSLNELDLQLPSLPFLQKLFDAFLSCDDEFRNLLVRNSGLVSKSPVDKLLTDLLDRAVKSLDICNDLTQSLQLIHHWNRHADIAASALPARGIALGEGQLNRTRRALAKLLASSEPSSHNEACSSRMTERAWSFLSRNCSDTKQERSHSRSLLRTWSAGKQLQAMTANLVPLRGCDTGSVANGLAQAVYTMSSVLVFTMWALVAAFPLTSSVSMPVVPPQQLAWAPAMIRLQERIGEEWRRRGRKGGVLVELLGVERCGKELVEAVAVCRAGIEVVGGARELGEASRRLEDGLGPFERQLREVFHRVVRSREEVMRCLEQSTKTASPFIVI